MQLLERKVDGSDLKFYIGSGLEKTVNDTFSNYGKNFAFISRNVYSIYRQKIDKFNAFKIYMNDGENIKSTRYFNFIIKKLIEKEAERDSNAAYVGGGTLGDLTGYSASVFKRGIKLTAIPTTLLSQVDSSIGGKNAIDFMNVKNAIGTFYKPEIVIDDIDFLLNSPSELLIEGMAEVLKMAIVSDKNFFDMLMENNLDSIKNAGILENIITRSIKIKLDIVSKDFYDNNKIRFLLNFGHSIGHAIEAYTKNNISHGTAVANGMIIESYIANKSGYSTPMCSTLKEAVKRYGLDIINFKSFDVDGLIKFIKNDKKVEKGKLNMVMLEDKGKATVEEIDFASLRRYLKMYGDELC